MKRIVIVGGGISGTAAAWTAERETARRGVPVETVLLEKEPEVGGKALSLREDGWLFETGPLGYVNKEPEVDALLAEAGLEGELLPASEAQSRRFVFLDGKLKEVAAHPLRFLTSGLLSPSGLLRAAGEPFIARKRDEGDESVWEFARRRLGRELADRLIHPMVLGIFAGDAKRLSLRSAFPIMEELERDYGSLLRAQFARARLRRRGELPPLRNTLCSFRGGLQTLPRVLSAKGGFESRTSSTVETILGNEDGRFRIVLQDGDVIPAEAVIVASEGWSAARMLRTLVPEASRVLEEISYPPVYVVALGYGAEARHHVPEGFGVLIPRGAGYRSLGVTWDGYLFPGRSPEGSLLVRVLLGGAFAPEIAALGEEQVLGLVEGEMERLLGLRAKPVFARTKLWRNAIPQYELGHAERVERAERDVARVPGLFLAGNALYGTAFGKAAARGVACGREAVARLFG